MSGKDKKILIVFIGGLICAALLFFGARKFKADADAMSIENQNLKVRLADLSEKASKADKYSEDIEDMKTKIASLKDEFPSELKVENNIIDAVTLEKASNVKISSIGIEIPQPIDLTVTDAAATGTADATADTATEGAAVDATADGATIEGAENTSAYQLYEIPNSFNFTSNTVSLKKLLDLIVDAENRQCVTSLTVAINSAEGNLSGTLNYSSYFLMGLDKEAEEAEIPAMKHGQPDIFRTGSKQTTSENKNDQAEE